MTTAPPQAPLQGQAALLKLLADASVAAVSMGQLDAGESLRQALRSLVPAYDGHAAHYAVALMERREMALAERSLDEAPADGPAAEQLQCVRGMQGVLQGRPGCRLALLRLATTAVDQEVRQAARYWADFAAAAEKANAA